MVRFDDPNMLNAIQAGIFNSHTKQRFDELEKAKSELELRIIQEEIKKPLFTREQVVFWICRFRKLDMDTLEGRRRLIDSFINSVVVYDDCILITFNYKDDAKTITFKEIESSDLSSLGGPCGVSLWDLRNLIRAFRFIQPFSPGSSIALLLFAFPARHPGPG